MNIVANLCQTTALSTLGKRTALTHQTQAPCRGTSPPHTRTHKYGNEFMDSIKYKYMEKKKPHYNLQEAQAIVVREGLLVFTQTAIMAAAALGLSAECAS